MFKTIPEELVTYQSYGRCFTVIQGRSGTLYPFYRSTGNNSGFPQTWFPWLGYFDCHPKLEHELYMVKPINLEPSPEMRCLIKEFLGNKNGGYFRLRIGNDECLALSCALGSGVWKKHPQFRAAVLKNISVRGYLKTFKTSVIDIVSSEQEKELVLFQGLQCEAMVYKYHKIMAEQIEHIIKSQYNRYQLEALNKTESNHSNANLLSLPPYPRDEESSSTLPLSR